MVTLGDEGQVQQQSHDHELSSPPPVPVIERVLKVGPDRRTGAGRGVTTGIRTKQQLLQAAMWASLFGSVLMIEDDLTIADAFREQFGAIARQLNEMEWDFAYFGHVLEVPASREVTKNPSPSAVRHSS